MTGGNAGVGFETARQLARRGARVLLGCRDRRKVETRDIIVVLVVIRLTFLPAQAELAVQRIREECEDNRVEFMYLDLSILQAVR